MSRRTTAESAVMGLLVVVLVAAAATRRDFIGDGVRHIPAALSGHLQVGEPRWLLFPPLVFVLVRPLSLFGTVTGVEGAIAPLLWLSVACGVVFLVSLERWLRAESSDGTRRAAALLLAGSCAPFLMLFSDVAEVQIATAIALMGLAYARTHQDCDRGAVVAIAAIACAALLYQATALAMGMLPLVARRNVLLSRRVMTALSGAVTLDLLAIVAVQLAQGTSPVAALSTIAGGERNPLMRSFMAQTSALKYAIALLAGPPQGIVAVKEFTGIPALFAALRTTDAASFAPAVINLLRLLLGAVCLCALSVEGVRRHDRRLLFAALILLLLPVLRNQQYGYGKFFALWPVLVALAAVRCPPRTVAVMATAVLVCNGWLIAEDIGRGRRLHRDIQQAYREASPSTCWMTSGWSPPLWYLWPGSTAPVLGTLATGSDPPAQAVALTNSLRRCFCQSTAVWTDTTKTDAAVVVNLAAHFAYRDIDLAGILLDDRQPANPMTSPAIHVYPDERRRQICESLVPVTR
jgi:hypothetical protein